MKKHRPLSVLLGVALLALASVVSTQAAHSRNVFGGVTKVIVSDQYLAAFKALRLTSTPVAPAIGPVVTPSTPGNLPARTRITSFPIVAGALDFTSAAGEIVHTGGLAIAGGGKKVTLTTFIIDTSAEVPVLTGLVTAN